MTAYSQSITRRTSQAVVWMTLCIATLIVPDFEYVTGINALRWRGYLLAMAIFSMGILLGISL